MSEGRFVVRGVTGWGIALGSRESHGPPRSAFMVLDRVYSYRVVAEFAPQHGRDGRPAASKGGDAGRQANAERLAADLNARYPAPPYLTTEGPGGSRSRRPAPSSARRASA